MVIFLFLLNANIIDEVFEVSFVLHVIESGQSSLRHHILIHSTIEVPCVVHLDVLMERVLLSLVQSVGE